MPLLNLFTLVFLLSHKGLVSFPKVVGLAFIYFLCILKLR